MTKTLTEQWREGTLPLGTYYIVNKNGYEEIDESVAVGELWNNTDLKEVLAVVPSYDEYKRLQEQLNEANKLIKWVVKTSWSGNQEEDDFDRYLEKWGVK